MVRVSVPCSTSNLGPGFDSLGLALGLTLEVSLQATSSPYDMIVREGDALFEAIANDDDLVLSTMRLRWRERGAPDRTVEGAQRSDIPTARGLGSSAAAVVAGVMLADALDGIAHVPLDVLAFAASVEGHPDNAAASVLGGLCCAYQDADGVRAMRLGDLNGVRAVVASPDAALSTKASRAVLPSTIGHREATGNLARAVYLSHALARGETVKLAWAFDDVLHQPYRAALLPGFTEAMAAARMAGAVGASLSGAGSSSLALVDATTDADAVAAAMERAYRDCGVSVTLRVLEIARGGASVT